MRRAGHGTRGSRVVRAAAAGRGRRQPLASMLRVLMSGSEREVPLKVGERSAHHGVGDQVAYGSGDEAAGIDAEVEEGMRPSLVEGEEPPFTGEVAEVAAEVFARDPVRLVVDLA